MKIVLWMVGCCMVLFANTDPYKKEIVLPTIDKPTLVGVALDNDIYRYSQQDYRDLRLRSGGEEEQYFIKVPQVKKELNHQTLKTTQYHREEATLIYVFQEPFDVDTIRLNIEDRNFESTVDIYADNHLIIQNYKIFDYSNETGNQRFTITIPKLKVKELKVVYHLDQTTAFYKKYRNVQEMRQYLTIKSATFSHKDSNPETLWYQSSLSLASNETQNHISTYIFHTQMLPFERLNIHVAEENFKRRGRLYSSEDGKNWHFIKPFTLFSSTIKHQEHKEIFSLLMRANYIKLTIQNKDNKPLSIQKITLLSKPAYLYFIAQPHNVYTLYFGDQDLKKPHYELESLVDNAQAFTKGQFSKLEYLEVMPKREDSWVKRYQKELFTVLILLAVFVMGYVAFGLLRKEA